MTKKTNNAISPPTEASGNSTLDATTSDTLSAKLAEVALTVLLRTCRQEVAAASNSDLEAVCAAMRFKARLVIDQLIDDVRAAPWVGEIAIRSAALDLAQAGIAVLRENKKLEVKNGKNL